MTFKDDENEQGTALSKGRYSNYFKIGHSAFEFVFDFGQFYTHGKTPQFHTRMIINPFYAKVFAKLLQDSLDKHEINYGAIPYDTANEPKY